MLVVLASPLTFVVILSLVVVVSMDVVTLNGDNITGGVGIVDMVLNTDAPTIPAFSKVDVAVRVKSVVELPDSVVPGLLTVLARDEVPVSPNMSIRLETNVVVTESVELPIERLAELLV